MYSQMIGKRILVYLDILGFKSALNSSDNEKIHTLLQAIKQSNKSYQHEMTPSGQDTYSIDFNPEISSFSDHIVISISEHDEKHNDKMPLWLRISELIRQYTSFCIFILEHGYLVRGALTYGELHHEGNFIYGQALVDAHKIESEIAAYPRIIIDYSMQDLIKKTNPNNVDSMYPTKQDFDGLYYIDWLGNRMAFLGPDQNDLLNQTIKIKDIIEQNLKKAHDKKECKTFKYWFWMAQYFNATPRKRFPSTQPENYTVKLEIY